MKGYKIVDLGANDVEKTMTLVKRVFMETDAKDYSEEGIREVMEDMIENNEFKQGLKNGEQTMIGAVKENNIIGIVAIDKNNHISLFFVDNNYHRKGIGKALFVELVTRLQNSNVEEITLNSTPYAVPFYENIGFVKSGDCIKKHDVLYTPMKFML